MYFYNYFINLCAGKNVKPSRVALDVGLSKTAVNGWKTGKSLPTDSSLVLLSNYFNVPLETFMECEDIAAKRGIDFQHNTAREQQGGFDEDEINLIRQLIRERPEVRMLFNAISNDVPASEILTATAQILRYKEQNNE